MVVKDKEAAVNQPYKYNLQELMAGAETTFGVQPEIVFAALKTSGISEATIEEAKAIIDEFNTREVSN